MCPGSRSVILGDRYLGPSQGKTTVYERRAKLLYELDKQSAQASQHRALAEQLKHTAELSATKVGGGSCTWLCCWGG